MILMLVLLNAFFVMAEYSLAKIRRGQLEDLQQKGRSGADTLLAILDKKHEYISVIQIGITTTSLLLGWYGGPLVMELLCQYPLQAEGETGFTLLGAVSALLVLVAIHVAVGELVPRLIVLDRVESIVLGFGTPLRILHFLLYPLVWVLFQVAIRLARLFGVKQAPVEVISRSEEELRRIVSASEMDGELDSVESTLIDNVFEFNDTVAREVMIPRQDMICLFTDDTLAENLETIRESCHTRYPLCEEDKDHVLGMIHVRDLMDVNPASDFDLRTVLRRIIVVPESMSSARVLQMMQQKHVQIAVVADEYGGTAGLLTLEDLVEEIVGEIQDEHDEPELPEIVRQGAGLYELDGEVLLDDLRELLGLTWGESEADDTIGGYIFSCLGRKPEVGDEVVRDNWTFTVLQMDQFRIERVKAEKTEGTA